MASYRRTRRPASHTHREVPAGPEAGAPRDVARFVTIWLVPDLFSFPSHRGFAVYAARRHDADTSADEMPNRLCFAAVILKVTFSLYRVDPPIRGSWDNARRELENDRPRTRGDNVQRLRNSRNSAMPTEQTLRRAVPLLGGAARKQYVCRCSELSRYRHGRAAPASLCRLRPRLDLLTVQYGEGLLE